MTTAQKRTVRRTAHVRTAEKILGGPLEETLKDYLNERGTMSDLAKAVGVQKATVNYWIMRLGINYERVAYDGADEVVRVMSREEAEVADAAIESGLEADDVASLDSETFDAFDEFRSRPERSAGVDNLTEREIRWVQAVRKDEALGAALDAKERERIDFGGYVKLIAELVELGIRFDDLAQLSASDVQLLAHIKEIGGERRDFMSLTEEAVEQLRKFTKQGMGIEDFADFDWRTLMTFNRLRGSQIEIDELATLTRDDLDMLGTVRDQGWTDAAKLKSDLDTLRQVREAGLDDQQKLNAARIFMGTA